MSNHRNCPAVFGGPLLPEPDPREVDHVRRVAAAALTSPSTRRVEVSAVPGRLALIVWLSHDVPATGVDGLAQYLSEALEGVLDEHHHGPGRLYWWRTLEVS